MKLRTYSFKGGKMKKKPKIQKRYNRISIAYDFFEWPMELFVFKKLRKMVSEELENKTLEVGVGTGKNIPYYPDGIDITAIDFSKKMLKKAKKRAKQVNKEVSIKQMDVEHLEFEDNTFDTVFTTFVFCSVPNPIKGLKEIKRVCKNGGKIILLEHVRSDNKVLGKLMDIFNFVPLFIYGANINRRTVDNVKKAGFNDVFVEDIVGNIVKKITIINNKSIE